ncbi:MAG: class I SAM-dependent methyltransferase [Candidatus Pacebacteria bacterium]|nr:class I SAM-dependent methyltransferase [Candidatus Paceibacterota bacterium]
MVYFLEPEKIIEDLNLREDATVADFGCGSGGFTIPLAKKLKRGGFIYALDIQQEALSALLGNAKLFGLNNIRAIKCDIEEPEGSTLPDNSLDAVFIVNLLFEVDDPERVVKEAKRVAKPDGKIIVIDWKKDASFGPEEKRVGREEIETIARHLDLEIEKEIDAGTYHWGVVLRKKKETNQIKQF